MRVLTSIALPIVLALTPTIILADNNNENNGNNPVFVNSDFLLLVGVQVLVEI